MEPYHSMNPDELEGFLKAFLDAKGQSSSETAWRDPDRSDLLRRLEVHQIELEMQNLELRESHQQLEASRNRYAELYDSSPVGYATLDERGCIMEINLTGASMLGAERSHLAGTPFVSFIAPGEAATFLNHLKQCFSQSEPAAAEVTLLRRGEPPVPVQLISVARSDRERNLKVCRTTLIDFSERKRVEGALLESEERFRQLAETITEVFWMTNPDKSKILYMSPAYEKIWGRKCESLYKDPSGWIEAIHPEDRERIRRLAGTDQVLGGYDQEFRIIRPDGSVRWIRDRAFPIEDKSGRVYRVAGIAEDITEGKRTEEALRAGEAQLRDAQQLAHIGSWEWEVADNRVLWSDELHRIWGVSREGFVATYESVLNLVHPDDRSRLAAVIDKAVRERKPYVIDHRIIRPDGTERILQSRGTVVADETGRVVRMFGTGQDITERKQAEARLAYQADLLMNVHDAILATDETITVTEWNLAAEKIYGWSRAEALGRKAYEVVRSEFFESERSKALKDLAEAGQHEAEVIHYHRDGKRLHIHTSTIALRDEAGKIIGYVSANRDITERCRSEEALRTAKEFSENLIQTGNVIILSLDSEGRIEIFNQAAERITGYCRSELDGKSWFETLVPKDRYPQVWEEFNRLIAGGVPKTFENPILTKGGEERYIMWQNSQVWIDGKVVATISFGNDITERKKMEEALRKSDERFHLIARATNDAIWDWDLETNRIWWNESFKTLFGYKDEEIEPGIESWSDRLHPEEKEQVLASTHAAIEQGQQFWSGEYRFRRADGTYAVIHDRGYVVHREKGKPVRMVGAMMDITERKLAEESLAFYAKCLQSLPGRLLEAQETERSRIARDLHDQVGQSLTAIKIQLHAAQLHSATRASTLKECMQMINQALAEVQNISLNLHPSQLDELGLVAALRWHLDRQAHASNLIPRFSADSLPARLPPDIEIACFRVAQEAVTNVIRHANANLVSVELRRRGAKLHLIIQDDGRGFDSKAAGDRYGQGASLGLIGMRERTQLVGGRLVLNSSPGAGTQVHAIFPLTRHGPE